MEDILEKAYLFADLKHKGQVREDGSPYINHPIKVVKLLGYYYSNYDNIIDLKCAGYLHDTLEDTDTNFEEIENIFGSYIAYLVNGVTNDDNLKKVMGKTNYLCYKLVNMNSDVLDLKLCDRLANVIDLINADIKFINKYSLETNIIMNYLVNNRELNDIQYKVIDNINNVIKGYEKRKLLKYKI